MSTFVLQGGPQLEARLTAMGGAPKQMLADVGLEAVAMAKILVPRRTGNLGRTIRLGTVSSTAVEVKAGGSREVGYAAAVEFGSRARVIVPVRASVLAWGGPRTLGGRLRSGGRATNFARRVRHPGTRAQPYLFPGFERALRALGLETIVKAWNRAA